MKISDYKGEAAIELLGDLIEPVSAIMVDDEVRRLFITKRPPIEIVKVVLKRYSKQVVEILARIDGVEPKEYNVDIFTLPKVLLQTLNDPNFRSLFTSQGQSEAETNSGSAMVNTEEGEK